MDYIEISITDFTGFDPEIVIARLVELDFESFVETDSGILGYISEDVYRELPVSAYLQHICNEHGLKVSVQKIGSQNWNALWESAYEPVIIAGKCRVRAPFHAPLAGIPYEIVIEPRMSFGTAHHETTSLMLELLMMENVKGKRVLDMGCGTGVLAILAYKMGAAQVIAIDNDEWAFSNALDNMKKNEAEDVTVIRGEADGIPGPEYDFILANINRNVLIRDIPVYAGFLKANGILLMSGFYEEDIGQIRTTSEKSGLQYVSHKSDNKWVGAKFMNLLLAGLLMLLTLASHGQKQVWFSGDSTKFVGELNGIFFNLPDNEKKIITPFMEEFVQKWNQEEFDAEKKKVIYEMFNEMVKKKVRPYPDFFNYINALNIFVSSHQPDGYFNPWSDILKKLIIDKNNRKFVAFLDATTNLFESNLIYKSLTTRWKIKQPVYNFSFDTVPVIEFQKSDLVCYANDDSLNIYGTKGAYYPLSNQWIGQKGMVNWKRAGLEPDKIFALLSRYEIQMRFSNFTADSVNFFHKKYFPESISGRYIDKVLADVTETKASYPRFYSYDKKIGISRLFNNIDYLGGFAMEGSRIIGSGGKLMDASLYFKKDGKDFVVARSKSFIIRPDRINSGAASITIYYENDSVFHPGLQLKYIDDKKELSFSKDERVITISPWFDSYHKIEIYCEALYWKVGGTMISFEMMKGPTKESKAVFESSSYYSLHRYEKLRGIDDINPLNQIKNFITKRKSQDFTLDELTTYMNKPVEQVEVQILTLANRGFLVYDYDGKIAHVNKKLTDYVKAQAGKADYDVIFFNSFVTNAANGVLELDSFDLKLQGVQMIVLSDSQQVTVFPKNSEVILKKDLNFVFTGKIEAGLFDFYARDCYFEYDKFGINMPFIDSMLFYVRSKKFDQKKGIYPLVKVNTAITNLSGYLQIDDPLNKSGLKMLPQYPIFTNRNNAFVTWSKGSIQNGVYARDEFYYEVNPFTIRSMDVLATDSLKFTGSLTSAGIFPDITEPLKVRPDNSLGLVKTTDSSGFSVYGGKGTFVKKIDLSDQGLRGDGTLRYLNSTTYSGNFIFLPDSMKTLAKNISMAEVTGAVEFPAVTGDSVKEFWLPYQDSLVITSTSKEMAMYNNQSTFEGRLALTPKMLSGDGTVRIRDAEMDSKAFNFKRRSYDALIANFRIKSYDLADLTISTKNYQTHFDFDDRKGEFKSNIGISKVEFPINKYICSMDRFDWLIDSEEILLSNEQSKKQVPDSLSLAQYIDLAYTGSEFISVHPLQDSLKFFAAKARYNLRTNVINASEVKIIKVADAAIYPDSGKVIILKNAEMPSLKRAIILANTKTRFHQFYNAEVSISSRKNYTGSGDYDYRERTGEREQIHFDRIRVDSSMQTVAEGLIGDSAGFVLSPEFAFKGPFNLKADEKNLIFDGGFHAITDCFQEIPEWIRFTSAIDPEHVQIPVIFPLKNIDHEPINLGLMFFNTEDKIRPSFFRRKISFSDTTMITAEGLLEYNIPAAEFRISGPEKLKDLSLKGNYMALNTGNCMVRGEGKLNLSLKSGNFKIESYGILDYFILPDSIRLRCAMTLNFPFSEPGLERFSKQLASVNMPGVKLMGTPYALAMENMLDKQDFERLKNEQALLGKYKKFPEALERSIFLADVSMNWDSTTRSYVSFGSIGIANVGKNQVNRYAKGIIEFSKKRNGDEFTIFLELSPNDWFFFNYRNNVLMALSSDLTFNDLIREEAQSRAEQKRVGALAKGFSYTVATERKKRDFLRKFQPEENQ